MRRQAVTKHIRKLERAGLVRLRSVGRERLVQYLPTGLDPARGWFDRHDSFWDARLERLKASVEQEEKSR